MERTHHLMERRSQIIISASVASILVFSALAQVSGQSQSLISIRRISQVDNPEWTFHGHDDRSFTPVSLESGQADLAITALIRREISARKDMSVDARNIKINTKDGRVTLSGPVNTDEEKRLIGDIADRVARSKNVENLLKVKLAPANKNPIQPTTHTHP